MTGLDFETDAMNVDACVYVMGTKFTIAQRQNMTVI